MTVQELKKLMTSSDVPASEYSQATRGICRAERHGTVMHPFAAINQITSISKSFKLKYSLLLGAKAKAWER
jgi:hypothetical protein